MTGETAALLGVHRSLTGRRWVERSLDSRLALTLSQRFDLPELVARAMAGRGIGLDDAAHFLEPTLRDHLPDPDRLKDMALAADRLAAAVRDGEQVAIFGDYDVDGATSSAVLYRYLIQLGLNPMVYIPDRLSEGYGPNAPAMATLHERGARLVITVDCGTTSFDALSAAQDLGLEVMIVDHHEPEPRQPPVLAFVNPKRLDEDQSLAHLATVGLAFLLAVATNRSLRRAGWFANRREPELMGLLDLVALGTVCDVVPLKTINRAFVRQGLKVLAKRRNIGLTALCDVGRIDRAPEAYHLGYVLGPRINAGGRIGDSQLGARLLSSQDAETAQSLAARLDGLNKERQEIEEAVLNAAYAQVEDRDSVGSLGLAFVAGEGWHPGVVGIVASRLTERYGVPSCVMSVDGGLVTGSGRSIPGVDLGSHILAARQAGLLTRGGGHAMAAGFSCQVERLDEVEKYLAEAISRQLGGRPVARALTLDGVLSVRGASLDLVHKLERLAPFGAGNPEPRFAMAEVVVRQAAEVGKGHVRCRLEDRDGGSVAGIAFRAMETDLGPAVLSAGAGGTALHLAGRIRINSWQGRDNLQFQIEDGASLQR